jgi:hypothetical protein
MALVERLAILITGDASGAINEMKKVAGEAEKNAAKADGTASKFSGTATKIGAGMVAAGAGLLSTAVAAANTTIELGKEVGKLQRYTGMTAEAASKLAYAAKISGVDVDSLAVGIGKLSKTMADSPDKLTKLGVEAKSSDGKLRPMTDVLGDLADKFKTMGPGTEATAAALNLFGRSGANLLPFLLKGKDGIKELSDEAEKMGLVLSQDNIDAVKKNVVAQRELSAAVNGAKVQIGNEMLPVLTKFAELVTAIPGPVKDIIGPVVVLGGVVLVAGGAFLLMAGQVQKAQAAYANMSTTARTTTSVIGAAASVVTVALSAYSMMKGRMDEATASQRELNDALLRDSISGGLPSMQRALAETDKKINDIFADTGGKSGVGAVWDFLTRKDPWNAFSDAGKLSGLAEGRANLGMFTAASIALMDITGKSQNEMMLWLATQVEAGVVIPDVATAVAIYTGKIDANALGTEAAATAQDGYAASIRNASNALKATTDPYFAVIDAQGAVTEAQKKYNELSANGTRRTAESDAAYQDLVKSAFALTGAQSELAAAQSEGKASTASFNAAMETLRKQNIDPSTEAGKALIEKIYGVGYGSVLVAAMLKENPINPQVQQAQVDGFIAKLGEIKREYRRTWELIHGNPLDGDRPGVGVWRDVGAASGGFLPAGRPRLVGERGPELFVPSSSGSVVNALSTSHAMAGGGGGNTMTVNITMPPGTDGAGVVEAIRKYERMNGTGWRN